MSYPAWMAFAALSIIWGFPYFLIKVAVTDVPPLMIAWSRVTLAALILVPIAWRRGALRALLQHKRAVFAFAVIKMAVPFTAISVGERWISSSVAGMLIATVPLWIALLARCFGIRERLGAARLSGLLLGFAGVAALVGFGGITGPAGWAGTGCILLATLGYAIGPLIVQRLLGGIDAYGPAAGSLAIAALVLSPAAVLCLPKAVPSNLVLASVVALGALCTALAVVLMFYLIEQAGASRTAVITYINPAVAALLGVGLLHEHFGAGGIAAFALILIGSWLATRGTHERAGRGTAAVA